MERSQQKTWGIIILIWLVMLLEMTGVVIPSVSYLQGSIVVVVKSTTPTPWYEQVIDQIQNTVTLDDWLRISFLAGLAISTYLSWKTGVVQRRASGAKSK